MIRLALTDLDDTLIPVGAPRASERAIAGVHAMLNAGLRFGPVSGRVPSAMGWMFGGDSACYSTGAFSNGQMIYVDGKLVREEPLDISALQQVANILDGIEGAVLAVYDVTGDGAASFVTRDPARLEGYPEVYAEVGHPSLPSLEEGQTYIKANVHVAGDLGRRVEVRDLLRRKCSAFDFVFPNASAPLIDISPRGWDKGSAVAELARALGIGLDEVAVFGDSENDLSMLRAVPNSVAVANASSEVGAAARWHIGPADKDSVAGALEDIARAARTGRMPAFMS